MLMKFKNMDLRTLNLCDVCFDQMQNWQFYLI